MLLKNRIFIIGFVLSVLLFFQSCNKTWDDHYNTLDETTQKDKVISEMEKIPEISKFTEAVKQVDTLVDLLNQNRLYTVFAPVNETFETIDPEILNNKTLFTRLMLYHFIDGKFKYKDLSYDVFTAFNNKYLTVSLDNTNKVLLDNYATIIQQDFLSQNGMIQVIDQPLVPLNNLYEYFIYNTYSSQFGKAISAFTVKEFNQTASTPLGKNDNNEVIYDSVFNVTNPFLYKRTGNDYIPPIDWYGTKFYYVDISDEDGSYAFVFPVNYESELNAVKTSPFLNNSISDHHWAGPILTNLVVSNIITREEIISAIEEYNADPDNELSEILSYFADLFKNNFIETTVLSDGLVHLVDGFKYDMAWLITDQGNLKYEEKELDYRNSLRLNMTNSDGIDSIFVSLNNTKIVFYNDTIVNDYTSKYGEWVNFELEGDFYPVDYKIMVRGKNFASGTFKIEADGKEIGEYDFSTTPSGDNDVQFDEIGTVSFVETKSTTNLKFTFVNTHPATNKGEQYLWIREIKFSPIIK